MPILMLDGIKTFLNITELSIANITVGLICFIFQVALSAKYNYPSNAAGIWCGLIFVAAGCLALNAFRNSQNSRYKLVASGSALFAALFSILLLILISISINDTSERLETANAFKMQYGNNDIAQEIYHYRVKLGLMIVILMDSLVALCVNILLAMASYSLQPAYFPN